MAKKMIKDEWLYAKKVKKITWRDILDPYDKKIWFGHVDDFACIAVKAGYSYFNWNGIIYIITDSEKIIYYDTGLIADDIK
jgi:hypothetical protein